MKIPSKKIIIPASVIILAAVAFILFLHNSGKEQAATGQYGKASVSSMIHEYTQGKSDMKLTIGLLKGNQTSYKVFGANSKELDQIEYEYEIGSISKTFTASMLCKAVADSRVKLEDSISRYLPLDSNTFYPTVLSLATHTSGYGEYPFDASSLSKEELEAIDTSFYEKRQNIYQGINREVTLNKIKSHVLKDKAFGWEYSNFGIAVLGTVMSEVYDTSFKQLAEEFIQKDLGLEKTRLGNGTGNLNSYWTWNDDDTYFAAGGIVSTVTDLLKYGRMQIDNSPDYLTLSHKTYQTFKEEGFAMGLGWIIDSETGYLWHNGGTSNCTSFIGTDKEHHTVVVILSNYPAKEDTRDEDALDILGFTLLESLSSDSSEALDITKLISDKGVPK